MVNTDWKKLHGDSFRDARVLVTGGAGFIGSHLAEALSILGANVAVIDDLSGSDGSNLSHLKNVELIRGSILDESAVAWAVKGARYVFHLAAMVSVPASVANPDVYHQVNTDGTVRVLDAARKASVRRVMFSASSSAYGDSEVLPKIETMAPSAQSPYAATKMAGEQYIRAYASSFEMDAVSLRYFNIFGPRQNANSAYAGVIAAFARMLLAGQHPTITGDGTATRDFTFVHNAVHANLLAARYTRKLSGDVFNVATARSCMITELATKMAELLGRPDLNPAYVPPRPGDVKHSLAELTKSRTELGYQPIVEFEDGLRATVEWYRGQRK
ncbi:MAG TPA: NAD-dependent epimerase/dehydratase family protein [Tepidisphaeraceae bacterium]|jgi:UDP-glucose 4-epimerase|nr:NAD-dependent epimerase/dehydratase family protein [Tepidisphaeraceae bacterium]